MKLAGPGVCPKLILENCVETIPVLRPCVKLLKALSLSITRNWGEIAKPLAGA